MVDRYEQRYEDMPSRLTSRERRRIRREFKREQRAEERAKRRAKRRNKRIARAVDKAEAAADMQSVAQPNLYEARSTLCRMHDNMSVDDGVRAAAASRIIDAHRDTADRRFRYVAAIGTWITAILIAVLACSGCVHRAPAHVAPDASERTVAEQAAAAVQIDSECGRGSGVLINANEALTALHVVTCKRDEGRVLSRLLLVTDVRDHYYTAATVAYDGKRDIARVRLAAPAPDIKPVRIVAPRYAEQACIETGAPSRDRKCGGTVALRDDNDSYIKNTASVWFGNSGSGMYDRSGNLIGIVTAMNWCTVADRYLYNALGITSEQTCGSFAASPLHSEAL